MSLEVHLTMFKEIIVDFETLEINYNEEELWLILSCSLPSYMRLSKARFCIVMKLTLDEACDALFSKEKMK